MSTSEENEVQPVLKRLVCDLESKKTLCCCDDYPGVSEKVLNEYLAEHSPPTNPVFGKMGVFWIDEGYFVPGRDVVPGCCELAPVIGTKVSQWSDWSRYKGSLMLSVGAYIYDERTRTPTTVRTADVSFIPRNARRDLSAPQLWQLHSGELYAPSFVVEIDRLSGESSQLDALDECRKMVEYKLNEVGEVFRVDNDSWRDLDGGDVFPGFHLFKTDLEMALDPDFDIVEDEEIGFVCPERGCGEHVRSRGKWVAHLDNHLREQARLKYLAKRRKTKSARTST
ncbi:hypothetical protein PF005_g21531 [Phytophthora fragariae]|uniref:C2H2-type domain-containing protein n=2 Tax=Phytophthora fragariae TaxID=53985 RepID=A0A6A3Y9P9_9STRA|nr:hypothetical protein PF009_g17414 [Phytophthora fragariae]KAE8982629.1 hypothetical protein PF011_g21537 [Phytophthora fragariae]KAE9082765.1 hypothetical protein PF010_g21458 [Phytophthora fragariae]KAE9084495.1 hypothetical protein PF007_g21496 [Phytophthora fragariae]KAE9184804.1 hypothetical protein PF005_g21531 [Phytophthora fragariae]